MLFVTESGLYKILVGSRKPIAKELTKKLLAEVFPAMRQEKRLGIRLSPHRLRHSFAISFLRNGANPFELQIALGHTTLEMTRKYTQALGFGDVFKRHVVVSPLDRLIG